MENNNIQNGGSGGGNGEEKNVGEMSASGESGAEIKVVKKKIRKFRPAKMIAKIKAKKKNDSDNKSDSATSSNSSKLSSPKLSDFVKRLSGRKNYKVTPSSSVKEFDENDQVEEYHKLSQSSPNVSLDYDNNLNNTGVDDFESQPLLHNREEIPDTKKVQLKITISGKLNNNSSAKNSETEISQESLVDKASPLLNKDITLPSASTQLRLRTTRDEFFNVVRESSAKTVQSISTTQSSTTVVSEKWSETTQLPELKIYEDSDLQKIEEEMKKSPKSKIPVTVRKSSVSDEQDANKSEINFEVGTLVRPLKIIQPTTNNSFVPILTTESETPASSHDETFHSPKSEASPSLEKRGDKLSSSTRRKIAFIPSLTEYTAEEQEMLKSNIIANSDLLENTSMPSLQDSSIFPNFDEVTNSMSVPEKREHLYKILVIGELGTGKTSFIKRYVHQFFSQNYRATIGVDFALKVLNWDQSTIIRLQLWDIAGQERFGNMTRVYFKEAVGAFIVFDVTRTATFEAVTKWKQDLDSKVQLPDGSNIPCVLLANKCDMPKQGLVALPAKMDEYCNQNGFAGWFETSAKENTNIEEAANSLVSKILKNDKLIQNDLLDADRLILNSEEVNKNKKFCSC